MMGESRSGDMNRIKMTLPPKVRPESDFRRSGQRARLRKMIRLTTLPMPQHGIQGIL